MKTFPFLACLFLFGGCALFPIGQRQIPQDFRLYARLVSGDKTLETTVSRDGNVVQRTAILRKKHPHIRKWRLTPEELQRLFDSIERYKFFDLPDSYPFMVKDCPPRILTVNADGKIHRVIFPPCVRKEWSARRFNHIWDTILHVLAPSELPKKP